MRLKIYEKIRFGLFFRFLAFSSVICRPINLFNASRRFQKHQNKFNQKIYLGKNLAVTVIYFYYGHNSLKRERIFH